MSDPSAPEAAGVPSDTTLRWAVRLIFVQTAALAIATAFLAYASATDHSTTVRVKLSVTGYALIITLLTGLVGVSLARRRRWARGPAIVLELLQVPIGYGMVTGDLAAEGVPVLVVSVCAAVLLLAPSTRLALQRR